MVKKIAYVGIAFVSLFLIIMIGGISFRANLPPVSYDGIEVGDTIHWGIHDEYKQGDRVLSNFKAVNEVEILNIGDLEADADNETDMIVFSKMILGETDISEIEIPAYIDIYTISTMLIGEIAGKQYLPPLSSIHYIMSEAASSLQTVVSNITYGQPWSEENITSIALFLSFYHVGILPTSYDFNLLADFFSVINDIVYSALGMNAFDIINNDDIFKLTATNEFLNTAIPLIYSGLDYIELDLPKEMSFTMSWEKKFNLLKEAQMTFIYDEINIVRTVGFQLIATTIDSDYPDSPSMTAYADVFAEIDNAVQDQVTFNLVVGTLVASTLIISIASFFKVFGEHFKIGKKKRKRS